ncbi:MAG TPA: hypothetical protein PLZ51_13385, partial [Aggregatilineales bacterium]|nr:hypothetical protein [Aggregatilineales bacterium]
MGSGSDSVNGAIELQNGNVLSWNSNPHSDNTLELWESDGRPIIEFSKYTDAVMGVIELRNRQLLSWHEKILQLLEANGTPINTLYGHTDWIMGAIEL